MALLEGSSEGAALIVSQWSFDKNRAAPCAERTVMTMRLLLSTLLLALVLPFAATASETVAPATPAAETTAAEAPSQAVGCAPETAGLFENALDAAEPANKSCTYRCTMEFECPDIIDTPPATCTNGCCVYESSCPTTCNFDSDCGSQGSCWSGCCYFWNP